MALINPSNLYSEGQVNLDSTPYLRMQQQQQAKQQAREDALYKYFSELPNKINAAGMRVQDIDGAAGGFNKKLQDVRSFWDTNKQNIIRGGRAQQAYQQLIQDATQYADQSKKTAQFQLKFGQDYFKGKHKPRERDLEVIAAIDRPIDDETHYKDKDIKMPYGYNDFSIAAPDFDANRQKQFSSSVFGNIKPVYDESKARIDNVTGEVFIPKKYDDKDVLTIAENAAANVMSDRSAMNHYEDLLSDKQFIESANEAYQKAYKTNDIVDTPEKAAMADYIIKSQGSAGEEKVKDVNYAQQLKKKMADYNFEIWRKKNGITFGQRKQMAQQQHEYQKAMKFGYGNQWLDNEWKNVKDNPVDTLIYTNADGEKVEVKVLGASSKFKKYFESQGYEPDEVIMYPDGTYGGVIYKRDEKTGEIIVTDGKKTTVKSLLPVKLNEGQAKIAYGNSITTGKDLTEELSPAERKVLEEKQKEKSVKKQKLSW